MAANEREQMEWINSISAKIQNLIENDMQAGPTEETKQSEVDSEIDELINTNVCADCKAPNPEWISHNLGLLVCITCSGGHRHLSTDFSFVRGL